MRHRGQKRSVCLQDHLLQRRGRHQGIHARISEGQCASDSQKESKIGRSLRYPGRPPEAVKDAAQPLGCGLALLLQHADNIPVGLVAALPVARVQYQRQIHLHGQPDVQPKELLLRGVEGPVPVVIQAAFANGDNARIAAVLSDAGEILRRSRSGFGRMKRSHGVQAFVAIAQLKGLVDRGEIDGRQHDTGHSRVPGAADHSRQIRRKALVIQMGVGVG